MAFFPCIHFCDAKTMMFKGVHISQKKWSLDYLMRKNISLSQQRQRFFELLMKLVYVVETKKIRLVIENPWNVSNETYLQHNFIKPTLIDKNRMKRGDVFVKPTAYWFFNMTPTNGCTLQLDKEQRIVYKQKDSRQTAGLCSEERSMIHPDYARNFICDFILGKVQKHSQLALEL